jgi:hypothetical protein
MRGFVHLLITEHALKRGGICGFCNVNTCVKGKGLPQQAEVPQGVPGRLRPRIFLAFGTKRMVGRQP